jgi:hypothetical protein
MIGDIMFYGDKNQVRNSLHLLQRKVCEYDMMMRGTPPSFCDCKYGYNSTRRSEQTCCPELRTVVELLDKMTQKEYNTILERE